MCDVCACVLILHVVFYSVDETVFELWCLRLLGIGNRMVAAVLGLDHVCVVSYLQKNHCIMQGIGYRSTVSSFALYNTTCRVIV